jgi:hypothetical protein
MSQTTHRRRNTSVGLILAGAALAALAFLTPGSASAGSPDPGPTLGGTTIEVRNTPYSPDEGECDPAGWHIILNQVEPDGVDAGDFGNVTLQFSDGTTGTATFNKITPGGVASWYFQPAPGTAPQTVVSASMTFPAGTNVTSYGNFNISNPACYPEVPPTTPTTQPVVTVPTTSPAVTVPVAPAPQQVPLAVPSQPSYTG